MGLEVGLLLGFPLFAVPLAFSRVGQRPATLAVRNLDCAPLGLPLVYVPSFLGSSWFVADHRVFACLRAAIGTLDVDYHRSRLVLEF